MIEHLQSTHEDRIHFLELKNKQTNNNNDKPPEKNSQNMPELCGGNLRKKSQERVPDTRFSKARRWSVLKALDQSVWYCLTEL